MKPILSGITFSFATSLAWTFTACNIAALGAVAPLVGTPPTLRTRLRETSCPLGWLAVGMFAVSGAYGFVVGLVGTGMPQFTAVPSGMGLSARSIQSMVVCGIDCVCGTSAR